MDDLLDSLDELEIDDDELEEFFEEESSLVIDLEAYEMNEEDLNDGYAFSYVLNVDAPDCSEFGTICVKPTFGGLRRIG